ncbi:MAG TPA: hypothetical protein VLW45_03895 [Pelomicrobium sp.]|nr:hypothetical protein [Pelomicrobium sp.]
MTGADWTLPGRLERGAWIGGAAALSSAAAGAIADPGEFFRAWLPASLFWLGLSLGSVVLLMIHALTGGRWGQLIRPAAGAAAGTLPVAIALFLPLLLGLEHVFVWLEAPPPAKSAYLNAPFLTARTAVFLALWLAMALALQPWTTAAGPAAAGRSAAGLILYGFSVTFFAVDWIMALDPAWYSTAIGLVAAASQISGALALAVLLAAVAHRRSATDRIGEGLQDLGNLLLAAVMFWIYIVFMQYLIIWSGNLPHEIGWYLERRRGVWGVAAWLLVATHFLIPFALLASRRIKRAWRWLAAAAAIVVAGRLIDAWWLVKPSFAGAAANLHWLDAAALLGIGGVWVGTFLMLLRRTSAC